MVAIIEHAGRTPRIDPSAWVAPTAVVSGAVVIGPGSAVLHGAVLTASGDAVMSGAAASGEPWQFYDLGHGYCTYDFFAACPHRTACGMCSFYRPQGSSQAQMLAAKANLLRLKQDVPLTDESAPPSTTAWRWRGSAPASPM